MALGFQPPNRGNANTDSARAFLESHSGTDQGARLACCWAPHDTALRTHGQPAHEDMVIAPLALRGGAKYQSPSSVRGDVGAIRVRSSPMFNSPLSVVVSVRTTACGEKRAKNSATPSLPKLGKAWVPAVRNGRRQAQTASLGHAPPSGVNALGLWQSGQAVGHGPPAAQGHLP